MQTPLQGAFRCVWMQNRVCLLMWEKRGGWGKVMMISHGVEISIAGGGEEMVRVLSLVVFFFFSFFLFCNHV